MQQQIYWGNNFISKYLIACSKNISPSSFLLFLRQGPGMYVKKSLLIYGRGMIICNADGFSSRDFNYSAKINIHKGLCGSLVDNFSDSLMTIRSYAAETKWAADSQEYKVKDSKVHIIYRICQIIARKNLISNLCFEYFKIQNTHTKVLLVYIKAVHA